MSCSRLLKVGSFQALSGPLIDTDESFQKGKLAMAKKDYAGAAEIFSDTLERFVESYGQLAPECGEVYYQYGLALFREVEQQEENQDIFGTAVPKEIPTGRVDDAVAEAAPSAAKDSDAVTQSQTDQQRVSCPAGNKKVETGDDEGSESDKNNDGEDEEEEGGDGEEDEGQGEKPGAEVEKDAPGNENVEDPLQLAWEVLDTARTIFEKDSDKEIRLADTLLLLGDVNLRNEMFDNAVQDYEKCLALRIQLLKPDDRMIMEVRHPFLYLRYKTMIVLEQVHHQIAIAKLNYTDPLMAEVNRTSAVQALRKAIEVCELRLVNLNKILNSECVIGDLETSVDLTSRGAIEEEINELEGIKVWNIFSTYSTSPIIQITALQVDLEERIDSEETVGEAPSGQASGAGSTGQAMALGGGSLQELLKQAGLGTQTTQIGFGAQPAADAAVVVKSLGVFGKSKAKAAAAGAGAESSTGKRPADSEGDAEAAKKARADPAMERAELVSAAATPATQSPPKMDA